MTRKTIVGSPADESRRSHLIPEHVDLKGEAGLGHQPANRVDGNVYETLIDVISVQERDRPRSDDHRQNEALGGDLTAEPEQVRAAERICLR